MLMEDVACWLIVRRDINPADIYIDAINLARSSYMIINGEIGVWNFTFEQPTEEDLDTLTDEDREEARLAYEFVKLKNEPWFPIVEWLSKKEGGIDMQKYKAMIRSRKK